MMAESFPWREVSGKKVLGRTACVMMRVRREVLPALEGWWVVGGEMSSMMGLAGWSGRRESSSGMPENECCCGALC